MARKKTPAHVTATAVRERKSGEHINKIIALRPVGELRAQIEALAQQEHRTVAQMAAVLCMEAIAARAKRKPIS